MAVEVKFTNNLFKIKQGVDGNIRRALTALGTEAVSLIGDGMDTLYEKPIWDTGDLHRDVSFEVDVEAKAVKVGNTLDYAVPVHEGYAGHPVFIESIGEFRVLPGGHTAGRPYIRDSLTGEFAQERMKQVFETFLKQGFE